MIVSKIKFQDIEHVLTIMSSESSQMPIFVQHFIIEKIIGRCKSG